MPRTPLLLCSLLWLCCCAAAPPPPPLPAEQTTYHTLTVGQRRLPYSATAGLLPLYDDKGAEKARLFFVAYYLQDEPSQPRPVTFCFNGGPGSSSAWLHLGALGPRRVQLDDLQSTAVPPYRLQDNPYSLLPLTDLVFVDPVASGLSSASGDDHPFFSAAGDAASLADFIEAYITRQNLWRRPKFIVGESYGGFRITLIAEKLQEEASIFLNGLIYISPLLNYATIHTGSDDANDLPYLLFLPSFSASAHRWGKLPPTTQAMALDELLRYAEAFSVDQYQKALLLGSRLPDEQRQAAADKLQQLTGLERSYILNNALRISPYELITQLLRDENKVVGRMDARRQAYAAKGSYLGYFDPSLSDLMGVFSAAINGYLADALQFRSNKPYVLIADVMPWAFGKLGDNQFASVQSTLRNIMLKNDQLLVYGASGIYDLATPYFSLRYSFDHLLLPADQLGRITHDAYEGGHMFYLEDALLQRLHGALDAFYQKALKGRRQELGDRGQELGDRS